MNKVMLMGNITRDPEIRVIDTPNQQSQQQTVANFGLAMNERWTDQRTGERRESVTFIDVEAWGRQAEIIGQYMKKGSQILLEGSIKEEKWVAEDGTNRTRHRVRLQRFEFTGTNPNGNGNGNWTTETPTPPTMDPAIPSTPAANDDGIPF